MGLGMYIFSYLTKKEKKDEKCLTKCILKQADASAYDIFLIITVN